jgi:hypothetical protein
MSKLTDGQLARGAMVMLCLSPVWIPLWWLMIAWDIARDFADGTKRTCTEPRDGG